jgi:hypothetical protein
MYKFFGKMVSFTSKANAIFSPDFQKLFSSVLYWLNYIISSQENIKIKTNKKIENLLF